MLPTPPQQPQPPTSTSSSLTGLDPSLLLSNPYLVQQQQQQNLLFPGMQFVMQPNLLALPRPPGQQQPLLQNPYLVGTQQRLLLQQQQQQLTQQLTPLQFPGMQFPAANPRPGLLPQPTAAVAAQNYAAAAAAAAAAGKRSFDQAFQPAQGGAAEAKRPATYSANPTISANPTTYHTSQ